MKDLPKVLVIDDDPGLREALTTALEREWEVRTAATGDEGLAYLAQETIPVVLLDICLLEMDGLEVLRRLKAHARETEVLMLTAIHEVATVVQAMQQGAADFVTTPVDIETLRVRLHIALARYQRRQPASLPIETYSLPEGAFVIGQSPAMRQLWDALQQVAVTTATVLIIGESGTGKGRLARALHAQSVRRDRPFVTIDCASLPETLVGSTLFGHERGAFTGAERRHIGAFERAHTGTLLLDDIGALPLVGQAALLRVLQERAFERVGGETTLGVDVRIIAATNPSLPQLVTAGTFRADLFYRLQVVPLYVPPLRERRQDLPLLVAHLLTMYNAEYGRTLQGITATAMQALCHYSWPGNVRELEHLIARLVALNRTSLIELETIQVALGYPGEGYAEGTPSPKRLRRQR